MNDSKIKTLALRIADAFPVKLQHILFKTLIEWRFLIFRIRWKFRTHKNTPDPARIYWISPERIIYHTNYLKNDNDEGKIPFYDRSFNDTKMRGQIVDGNWDVTNYRFTDLDAYDALARRIREGAKWQDTKFYKWVLEQVESEKYVWDIKNADDLDRRCEYIDSLYQRIKNEGYRLNRNNYDKNITYDEIDVNIGRNGEYLFQNGVHRLSIAKILGIKYVPVMVFVRHKKWQEFREFVLSYAQQQKSGKLYQPIVHPDLADIPFDSQGHECQNLVEAIKIHLGKKRGIMLDIGSNLGFYCHKFEELGYQCYAIEQEPAAFQILERIRIAENRKFKAINQSVFEVDIIKNREFDVVLALNIFHHFLKRKKEFFQLQELLRNLKTNELFFEPHLYREDQMKESYVNFTESEFVDFVLRYTSLQKSELIYTTKSGRPVFKLSR